MKLNDNDIIDALKIVEHNNSHIDKVKEITYQVALCLATKYKQENRNFDSGDFMRKLLT